MYLKNLEIYNDDKLIRKIDFQIGLNFIVDNTPVNELNETGNNVGKTTVLKIIDFCLDANPKHIYTDEENQKNIYHLVKDHLTKKETLFKLILCNNSSLDANTVTIERNLLRGKKMINRINGENILKKDFEEKLKTLLFPKVGRTKPTFRQLIAHNIRYKQSSIFNTIKHLDKYTTDLEYETLYLELLGCNYDQSENKKNITDCLKKETQMLKRILNNRTKSEYEIAHNYLIDEIKILEKRKRSLNINESLNEDFEALNRLSFKIGNRSSELSNIEMKIQLIEETTRDLSNAKSDIDTNFLKQIYSQFKVFNPDTHKTFEELVEFHNNMIDERNKFVRKDLPLLKESKAHLVNVITGLSKEEKDLSKKVTRSDTFKDLEDILKEINDKYRVLGEHELRISQINESEELIEELKGELHDIETFLFSDDYEILVKNKVTEFNKFFSSVSKELYGEKYALSYEIRESKIGDKYYQFTAFNTNFSSGKKQGEVLCFDIAYTLYAENEEIDTLKFLLNDKKELMHDNQLINTANYLVDKDLQLVISILKDKLPSKLQKDDNIVLELATNDKLLRIENE
ncbi:MAG: hypothetical protein KQ78_01316 [Candidatus Izimaplasma bacterium HR2]|nr:MAG: hypothetical protein KQ78_01316 [Candidatus Izimaplasma bacterium HR2]